MAQSSRPGGRRPDQSSGGRRPRVAGLRKRAQARSSARESRSEVTEESAGEGAAAGGAEESAPGPSESTSDGASSSESAGSGSAPRAQRTEEPEAAESAGGSAADESAQSGSETSAEAENSGRAEVGASTGSVSESAESGAAESGTAESGAGSVEARSTETRSAAASSAGSEPAGRAGSEPAGAASAEAESPESADSAAATAESAATRDEPAATTSESRPATTPGSKAPESTSAPARPTGRAKRRGTRIGVVRSESSEPAAAELPRAKPVQSTTAVTERDDTAGATAETARSSGEGTGRSGFLHDRRVWFLGSLALSVVFALLAGLFGAKALGLLGGPQSNEALVDQAATSEVNGQVGDAVSRVFSYDFANTKKTEDAAGQVLTGKAVQQYNDLFATVKQQAPAQKLVVTTTVKSSGVTRLQGDHAQVLLFVDQNATRTTTGESNVGPAQISVGAVKDGDQWKIDSIIQR